MSELKGTYTKDFIRIPYQFFMWQKDTTRVRRSLEILTKPKQEVLD